MGSIGTLLNFNIISLPFVGCLTESSYFSTFGTTTMGPVFAGLCIALFQKLWILSGRSAEDFGSDDVERHIFFILFLVYPRTSQVILSMFNCHELADGSEYLKADFSIECTDKYKLFIMPVAGLFTLLYPIGVPLVIWQKLNQEKKNLYDPITELPAGPALKKLGPMYEAYEPAYWWWEVLELYRKLFLCAILQYVQPDSPSQIIIAIVFTVFYSSFFSFHAPYIADEDDLLMVIAQLEIFSVALASLLLKVRVAANAKVERAGQQGVAVFVNKMLQAGFLLKC